MLPKIDFADKLMCHGDVIDYASVRSFQIFGEGAEGQGLRPAVILVLVTSPSTNLISLPFSHPTCDRQDVKRFLFRAASPKAERKIFILGPKGQFWG